MDRQVLLLNLCFGAYFFFLGAEYAVILPTINGYLISLDGDNTFLGIVLASFSFAGLISAPLYGYVTDRMGSAKASIIAGNVLEIIGNFMYFVGGSKYMVLGGRVVAGLGSGSMSSIMGTMSRSTKEKDRTSSFALLLMLRQFGLLVGPGFNAFLYKLNFTLGPFVVNLDSSPGLFMVLVWTINTLMFIFLYSDRHTRSDPVEVFEGCSEDLAPRAEVRFSTNYAREFLREEVVLLLAVAFFSAFVQTGVEAALTPLTLMYFDWHGLSNSYIMLGGGAVVILSFFSVNVLSKRLSDRVILLMGCLILAIGYAMFVIIEFHLCYIYDGLDTPDWLLPVLGTTMFVWIFGICYVIIPNISLFSKLTSRKTQAFNQGVRIGATRMGMILGPLWATPMVTKHRLPIMAGLDFAFALILVSMVLASYRYLVPPPCLESAEISTDSPTEASKLLSDHDRRDC